MKKPVTFPYLFTFNGRTAKVYHDTKRGRFKTRFTFQGKSHDNSFPTFESTIETLKKEFSKIDTETADSAALFPLNFERRNYWELEQMMRDEGSKATVREAVLYYLAHNKTKKLSPATVTECAAKFIASRKAKNVTPIQIKTLEKHLNRFAEDFGNREIHDITALEIQNWIDTQTNVVFVKGEKNSPENKGKKHKVKTDTLWSVKTRTSCLGSLVGLSLYSQKTLKAIPEGTETEFQNVERPKKERKKAVEIYSPAEILLALKAALETDVDLIPVIVLGSFQGLRPFEVHGEDLKRPPLTWEAINWMDKLLHVEGQKIRSKATRDIPLHAVTQAWLAPFRDLKGKIWNYKQAHSKKMIALRKVSGVQSIYDGYRHSYASYRIRQLKGNLDTLADEMGNSPAEIIDSYKRGVTDEAAEAWFNCMPPADYAEKVKLALTITLADAA
jgi:hypothetical protein